MSDVYLLVIEVGKREGDDLPEEATGAAFIALAPATSEEEAVHDSVKLFKEAKLNPLEVTNYGTLDERAAEGAEVSDEERALAKEAAETGAVIILDKQVFYGNDASSLLN